MDKKTFDRRAFAYRIRKITPKPNFSSPETLPASSGATHHVTDRAQGYGLQALRTLELKSIYMLFAWVANEQHKAEETIQCITETRFGVDHVSKLKQKDYDEVIKFLIDLRIDEMQH